MELLDKFVSNSKTKVKILSFIFSFYLHLFVHNAALFKNCDNRNEKNTNKKIGQKF